MTNRFVRLLCVSTLMFVVVLIALSATSSAQVGFTVRFGPPPLPIYEQPLLPDEGYMWAPGYWAFDNDYDDYYWVPGTWVQAPEPGYYWTPGYWGWGGDGFMFHEGYWGPRVGYYGGINYGYGYFGEGYQGGRWDNGRFFYNRAANNVPNVRYVYETTVINNYYGNTRVSYNGGEGGVNAHPRPEDEAAEHERHIPPVAAQAQQVQVARRDPELRASENRGRPPVAATPKPGEFKDHAVPAKEAGGTYTPRPNGNAGRPNGNPAERNAEQPDNRPADRPADNAGDRNAARPNGNPSAARPDDIGRPKNVYHPKDLPPREQPAPQRRPRFRHVEELWGGTAVDQRQSTQGLVVQDRPEGDAASRRIE